MVDNDLSLLAGLKVEDLLNFLEIAQLGSIRELARRRNVDPATISRSLARIEELLHRKLISRSAKGALLTADGQEIYGIVSKAMNTLGELSTPKKTNLRSLNFGANSFISNRVLAPIVSQLGRDVGALRLLDFPPDELVAAGLKGILNVAVHFGELNWPDTWSTEVLGKVPTELFCRHGHPLLSLPHLSLADVLEFPFVYPVYWGMTELVIGDDQFPVPLFQRKRAMATATAETAATVVKNSDYLGFFPRMIALEDLESQKIARLQIPQVKVERVLYMTVKSDEVKAHHVRTISNLIRPLLAL